MGLVRIMDGPWGGSGPLARAIGHACEGSLWRPSRKRRGLWRRHPVFKRSCGPSLAWPYKAQWQESSSGARFSTAPAARAVAGRDWLARVVVKGAHTTASLRALAPRPSRGFKLIASLHAWRLLLARARRPCKVSAVSALGWRPEP